MATAPSPNPYIQALRAYRPSLPDPRIEWPLGGTERPTVSASMQSFAHAIDAQQACHYPRTAELEATLGQRLGVSSACVLVTAGADEALDRACRAFLCVGRELLVATPTFEMILHYAQLCGATTNTLPWLTDAYPTEAMLAAATEHTHMIAVVSPNNPTGAVIGTGDLQRLATAVPHALLVVDMAYAEFADTDISAAVLALPNALMVRTLSKAWAVPGLRVGYVAGPAHLIEWLRAAGGPYTVTSASLAAAQTLLHTGAGEVAAYVARVGYERRALEAHLQKLAAAPKTLSYANFVLAQPRNGAWLQAGLAALGVGCRKFQDDTLAQARRITCPADPAGFQQLLAGLDAVLAPRALLFDLDGVLADVSESYRAAIIAVGQCYGVTITRQDIAAVKAAGDANNDWVVTHRLLQQRGVDVPLRDVTACFEQLYQGDATHVGLHTTERFIGAIATLQRLRTKLPLALVTGRPRADAVRFLNCAHIADFFTALVCMEDAALKPDPAPVRLAQQLLGVQAAWMIGDTPDDMRAARGALVVPVGFVAPGDDPTQSTQALMHAGAACVVRQLETLEEMLS